MTARPWAAGVVAVLLALPGACTNDYSEFTFADIPGTGGSPPDGSSGSGGLGSGGVPTGGSGGAGTGGAGAAATGGAGGGPACSGDQKSCAGQCVSTSDPAFGCGSAGCDPCVIANAGTQCASGQCALSTCNTDFDDCNSTLADGCEQSLLAVGHCGACNRPCSPSNSVAAVCEASACKHRCTAGFGDCTQPTSGPDDGCETDVASTKASCGSCGNDCGAQGAAGGFQCSAGVCGCSATNQCNVGGGVSGSCDTTTGLCSCGGSTCRPGEHCGKVQGNDVCRCNAQTPCGSGQTCCQTPSGCRDLQSDDGNCGACGKVCPQGLSCKAGSCEA
ncbi:MAG: hypothetical protein KF718_17570 [Polyangiaceae bacterium]|nr:hypothetical protein [Polyangiaceae bacterium]